ncbi:MAG: DUF2286 domain-containing protein [Candidatus Nezhaarchaeota archaeon]|nr:DUF2286 domain-containing protein [Candidatus Nezhaarchaeota archaeon]
MRLIVARSSMGGVKEAEVVEGELSEVVKRVVLRALEMWDMRESDFIVMRDRYVTSVKLPLTKEQYEEYSKYELRRVSSSEAEVRVPIYVVSYSNEWRGDNYIDKEVFIIAPYINEAQLEEIKELASNATTVD